MKKQLKNRVFAKVVAFALALTLSLPATVAIQPATEVYASVDSRMSSINSATKSTVMMQANRIDHVTNNVYYDYYQGSDGKMHSRGICNICAITNVLNRRLYIDGKYSTSNYFRPPYVLKITAYNAGNKTAIKEADATFHQNYKNNNGGTSKRGWLWKYDSGSYSNTVYSFGSNNYKLVDWNRNDGKSVQGTLAAALDKHHEGVFVRMYYNPSNPGAGGHCVVFTDYTKDSKGNYTFYVLDTVTADTPVEYSKSYIGGRVTISSKSVQYIKVLDKTDSVAPINASNGNVPTPNRVYMSSPLVKIVTTEGTGKSIQGTIASEGSDLTYVKAVVYIKGTRTVASGTSPVEKKASGRSYVLKNSELDKAVKFGDLKKGDYTLVISAKNAKMSKYTEVGSCDVTVNAGVDYSIKLTSPMSNISTKKGNGASISGVITSNNCNLTKIKATICKENSYTLVSGISPVEKTVTGKTYTLKGSEIDKGLTFGKLNPGRYTVRVYAQNEKNSSYKEIGKCTVYVSTLKMTTAMTNISTTAGKGVSLNGVVGTTGTNISRVEVRVLKSNGQAALNPVYEVVNTTSYTLKGSSVDKNLKFGTLAKGTYRIEVYGRQSGMTTTDPSVLITTSTLTVK